jgi:hypothetical protein
LFQVADIEKSGIPIVSLIYEDQSECFRQAGLLQGEPHLRYVAVSRTMQGPEDVNRFLPEVFRQLTRPLTAEEQKTGSYTINQDRILFEGTLEEAEKVYMATDRYPALHNAPIARYTDGLPVIIPTEEKVAAMLKGTSHKPDEIIALQTDQGSPVFQTQGGWEIPKGTPVKFRPVNRTATVEQVAVNAVMAGCTPEMFPVVLAIAESGGGGGPDGRGSVMLCVSGPIAKEIGMNFDVGLLGPGNPANRSLARASELMWRNFGGNIPNVTNCGVMGAPLLNVFPENLDLLPPGWKGLNEEYDYRKNDSVLFTMNFGRGGSTAIRRTEFSPGGYRAFIKSGHGGIARRLGVKGVPGPKNWLKYMIPGIWHDREGGITFLMLPQMAQALYDCGFKSKDEVYEWIYRESFTTLGNYRTHSWVDVTTNSWQGIEPTSGKPYKELPDDYQVSFVNDPYESCIIVTGSGEEYPQWIGARKPGYTSVFNIDAWR